MFLIVFLIDIVRKKMYSTEDDVISPPLRLGVAEISNKSWFYKLHHPGELFDSVVSWIVLL